MFVERAIRSVLHQTVQDFEILIVNDGSTDTTAEVLDVLAIEDPRIRVRHLSQSVGVSAARNAAIEHSSGSYIAFLDDDDEWLPSKLEVQLAALREAPPDVAGVYSPYWRVDASGRTDVWGAVNVSGSLSRREFFRRNLIATPSVVLRRDILAKVGGFDETLPCLEDWDLWVRISAVAKFIFVPEPLVKVHFTPGSLTMQSDAHIKACHILVAKVSARDDINKTELADWHYALGHVLMISGVPWEGKKLLRRSIRLWPWPPQRLGMALLAECQTDLYQFLSALHRRLIQP